MTVSVVIPLYNKEPYIQRALDSVLAQTYQDFEVIVVDDGSTDGGGVVVARCADPRIRLIRQENAGVSAARNRGVEEAKGEWIAFLDADDEWLPGFLTQTIQFSREHPSVGVVFTNYLDSRTGKPFLAKIPEAAQVLPDYFAICLRNNSYGMCSSGALIRRSALNAVGGFPVGRTMGEDQDTWARLAWTCEVGIVPQVLAVYHTGLASAATMSAHVTNWSILDTYRKWNAAGNIPRRLRKSTHAYVCCGLLNDALSYYAVGERRAAWATLNQAPLYSFPPLPLFAVLVRLALPLRLFRAIRSIHHRVLGSQ